MSELFVSPGLNVKIGDSANDSSAEFSLSNHQYSPGLPFALLDVVVRQGGAEYLNAVQCEVGQFGVTTLVIKEGATLKVKVLDANQEQVYATT